MPVLTGTSQVSLPILLLDPADATGEAS